MFSSTRVMNVIAAVSRRKESTYMKTFTIDADNNITIHASKKAARETGAGVFSSAEELAELIGPDSKRLVEIWNSLTGVTPVAKFANRKVAVERIWKAIQSLGEAPVAHASQAEEPAAAPEPAPAAAAEVASEPTISEPAVEAATDAALPQEASETATAQPEPEAIPETATPAEPTATIDAPAADVAPAEGKATKKTTAAKKAPKAKAVAKKAEPAAGPREGSKTAQVVAMLKREGGATLEEIMTTMAWQKHTVRGFMAGAMKKAGFTVESFKPEGGERTYRINS
jgi:hypothetical protein